LDPDSGRSVSGSGKTRLAPPKKTKMDNSEFYILKGSLEGWRLLLEL
jgi:hypothetical protein